MRGSWGRWPSASAPSGWAWGARNKVSRSEPLLFSAASSPAGPRAPSREHRQVVMPLTSSEKRLFPLQRALPRSGLQGSLQEACGMGQEQDLTRKYGPSLGSHLVSHW